MIKKYRVTLTPEERAELEQMIRTGKSADRQIQSRLPSQLLNTTVLKADLAS